MFAGLPGTGIGGVFYLLLTVWMPVHELYLLLQGRSSAERWRFIAGRWAIFAAVILVMWLQVKLLARVFPQGAPTAAAGVMKAAASVTGVEVPADSSSGVLLGSSLYAGMVLVAVIATVHLIRLGFWYRAYLRDLAYELDLATDWNHVKAWAGRTLERGRGRADDARVWVRWNVVRRLAAARG